MYAAKVKLGQTAARFFEERPENATESTLVEDNDDVESVAFSAGNPRVEHITGLVHLFKEVPKGPQALNPLPALPVSLNLFLLKLQPTS